MTVDLLNGLETYPLIKAGIVFRYDCVNYESLDFFPVRSNPLFHEPDAGRSHTDFEGVQVKIDQRKFCAVFIQPFDCEETHGFVVVFHYEELYVLRHIDIVGWHVCVDAGGDRFGADLVDEF